MKKTVIAFIALFGFIGSLNAQEAIDLMNYRVKIIKQASKEDIEDEIEQAKFDFGSDLKKIVRNVDFDCSTLGLPKTDAFKNPVLGYVEYTYKKEIKKDIEALCEEKVFANGTDSIAFLIAW
jgi:hypothetical protein